VIKKIDIHNFGSFSEYSWDSVISQDYSFKDVNIIYGRNYSGKTTLSKVFRCLEKKTLHTDYDNPNFKITLDNDSEITCSTIESNSLNICVYNTDFVKDNLNWLRNEDGTIEPFAILGGENNEIEEKINRIESKLGDDPDVEKDEYNKGLFFDLKEKQKKYNDNHDLLKKLKYELEKKLKNKAKNIKENNSIYNDINYNFTKINRDIKKLEDDSLVQLEEEKINEYKSTIKEETKSDIKELPEQKPKFDIYFGEVNSIVSKKIKPSEPIQDLLNDSLLQEWARKGRELHEGKRDSCAFCGNPIDDELWKKLDAHFSKESEELRSEIDTKINNLKKSKERLSSFISFKDEDFYSLFQKDIREHIEKWEILKESYNQNIEQLINKLNDRKKDIFKAFELESISDVSDDILELVKKINTLIRKNNDKTKTLSDDKKQAIEQLRLSEVSNFYKNIDYKKSIENIELKKTEVTQLEKDGTEINTNIVTSTEEIRKLKNELKNESKGAELVNEYLENFFGQNGFKLVPIGEDDGVKYQILRDGNEAKNLSEGECSLVSFCYFIAKIKDELESENSKLILYIDDPMSSLDSNHIFFVFSLIESIITKGKKYKQLFISTHNLDFLKYIKRLTVPKKKTMHFLIEAEQRQNHRRSCMKLMPHHLKDYTTEFNYLFSEIYLLYKDVSGDRSEYIESTYNQFYNIPNNIRKFLEYYLFYKYPNSNSPLKNLDKLFDGNTPALLNRVVNELSHLTFIDRGWSPLDVSEVEECVKIVIEMIKRKDIEQYNALKSSIGEKEND